MGDEIGIKGTHEQRDDAPPGAIQLASPARNQRGQENRSQDHRQSPQKEHAVQEQPLPKDELNGKGVAEPAPPARAMQRQTKVPEQGERQGTDQIEQGRMPFVAAEPQIAGLEIGISPGQVVGLIDGGRFERRREHELGEKAKQEEDCEPPGQDGGLGIGSRPWVG